MQNFIFPKHISKESRKWAQRITNGWEIEIHQFKILVAAAEQLDRIERAREQIKKDGPYFTDRYGCPRSHPALGDERSGKIVFARLIRELNLSETAPEARPPYLRYGERSAKNSG